MGLYYGMRMKSLVLFAVAVMVLLQHSFLAGAERNIIENAKAEGKLMFYATMGAVDAGKMTKAFEQKYPFIQVSVTRHGGGRMLSRILAEHSTGTHIVDVIDMAIWPAQVLTDRGLFMRYLSKEHAYYPDDRKDKNGLWTAQHMYLHVLAFNTKLLSRAELPRTYQDLLDPKWKGKMSLDTEDYAWFATVLDIMEREKGLQFMKELAKQNLKFRRGRSQDLALLAAGEFPLSVVQFADIIESQGKRKGAPVDWIALEPVVVRFEPIAIYVNAPHPNAAKLFVDFFLSEEGQKILRDVGRFPARPGFEPGWMPKGVKLRMVDPKKGSQFEEIVKEFNNIFLRAQ
jgi:iron(III) transport system substrate-binding protein